MENSNVFPPVIQKNWLLVIVVLQSVCLITTFAPFALTLIIIAIALGCVVTVNVSQEYVEFNAQH